MKAKFYFPKKTGMCLNINPVLAGALGLIASETVTGTFWDWNSGVLAEEVTEVNDKASFAFESSPHKASDFKFCILSLQNARNHNLYCWESASTSPYISHSADPPGIWWEEILFWFSCEAMKPHKR